MENVAEDFTGQVPASKAKTEIDTLREGQTGSYRTFPPVGPSWRLVTQVLVLGPLVGPN